MAQSGKNTGSSGSFFKSEGLLSQCRYFSLEILRQEPATDCVLVAVGGGGLISGIAAYLKTVNRNIRVRISSSSLSNAELSCHVIRAGRWLSTSELEGHVRERQGGQDRV